MFNGNCCLSCILQSQVGGVYDGSIQTVLKEKILCMDLRFTLFLEAPLALHLAVSKETIWVLSRLLARADLYL